MSSYLWDRRLGLAPRDTPVFLDVPEPNAGAMALAHERNMREVFATARMYNRGVPAVPVERIFGVTSFELG